MSGEPERRGECVQCGECCRKIRITSVLSHLIGQHGSLDEARKYYSYRGINIATVHEKSDRVLLEMDIACEKLDGNNLCTAHDVPGEKPLICDRYPWYEDDIESCGFSFVPGKSGFFKLL